MEKVGPLGVAGDLRDRLVPRLDDPPAVAGGDRGGEVGLGEARLLEGPAPVGRMTLATMVRSWSRMTTSVVAEPLSMPAK